MSIIPIFVYEAFDKRTCNPFLLLFWPGCYSCTVFLPGKLLSGRRIKLQSQAFLQEQTLQKKLCVIVAVLMSSGVFFKQWRAISTELEFVDLLTQIGTCPILYQRKIRYTVYIYAKNLEIRHIARGEIRKLVNSYGSYVKVDSHPAWLARIANVSADFLVTIPWHFASQFPFRLRKIPLESSLTQLPSMCVGGKPLTDFSRIMP